MFSKLLSWIALCLLSLVLVACTTVTAVPSSVATTSPTADRAVPSATVPTVLPTAAPLWTPTPLAKGASAPGDIVATVNSAPIKRADYEQQLAQARLYYLQQPGVEAQSETGQQGLQRLEEQVLAWMVDQVLIEQAAQARGINITTAQVEGEIARMRGNDAAKFNDWLSANGLTLEALRQQVRYDLLTAAVRDSVTAQLPHRAPQVHVRHILTSDEQAAQAALKRVQKGENFIAVARQVSEDEATRENGGDLGFLPRGAMPPAFEEVAFALKPGQTSDVVNSDFGFHILQVLEVDPNRAVPTDLWPMVQQRAFDAWLSTERAQAKIERQEPGQDSR